MIIEAPGFGRQEWGFWVTGAGVRVTPRESRCCWIRSVAPQGLSAGWLALERLGPPVPGSSPDGQAALIAPMRCRARRTLFSSGPASTDGTWPSLVGHLTGGQGVAGSNPAVPTVFRTLGALTGNQVGTIMAGCLGPRPTRAG